MAFVRFTPRQLEAFAAVAQERSFGGAAERLALSPSAISQLVAELEEAVGFRLFDRSTRKVSLTAAGSEFLGPACAALAQLAGADRAAADIRSRAVGRVRVAAPQALAAMLLPAVMADFAGDRPRVLLRILDTPVDQILEAVARGEADLAIGPDRVPGDDVLRHTLFECPWVLWCARDHALAALPQVRWRDLQGHPLVAAGLDHERSVPPMSPQWPADERVVPDAVVDHLTTALGLASRGRFVTLAPSYVEGLAGPMGLVMRPLIEPQALRQVCLYRPARRAASPAAEAFAEHLMAWIQHTGSTAFTCPVPDATK
jgi:DNA-binding transcriptional LysR family regulator